MIVVTVRKKGTLLITSTLALAVALAFALA